jgi:methionyl aminopeptidase
MLYPIELQAQNVNKSQKNEGPKIQSGMSLAIEPMLVLGDNRTRVSKVDNWTVLTDEIGAHFEHTIFIENDEVFILTK